ncbi:MAG: hypothetical protein ACP5RW_01620 [bacterium]
MRRNTFNRTLILILAGLVVSVLFRGPFSYAVGDTIIVFFYFLLPVLVNIQEAIIVGISLPILDFLLRIRVPPRNLLFFIILGDLSLILVFFFLYNRGRTVSFIGVLLSSLARYLIISQSTTKLMKSEHLYFNSTTLFFATLLGGILAFVAIPQLEKELKKRNELSR